MRIRGWIIFIAVFIAAIIQVTALDYFSFFGAKPDLLFLLTVFFSLYCEEADGLKAAFLGGLFKDITSTALFGSNIFGFCLCALFLGRYGNFYKQKVLLQALLCAILYYAVNFIVLSINCRMAHSSYFWMAFKAALYTGALCPALFFMLSRLFRVRIAYV